MDASVSFVVQFCNNAFKGILCDSALFAFIQKALEPFKLTFRFFKQTQSGTYHLAHRAIAALFNLNGYNSSKWGPSVMLVFLAMGRLLYQILVYHGKAPITRQGRPTR